MSLSPDSFFQLDGFEHGSLFYGLEYVWDALQRVDAYLDGYLEGCLRDHSKSQMAGTVKPGAWVADDVYIGPDVVIEPGAMVQGPTILGAGTVVRHGAYVRGFCVVGKACIIGHATELKRVIMLDESQAPHFNYVGDSILGRGVNLGAGTKLSNLKNDGSPVEVERQGERLATGLHKLGAVLGDRVQTGCNCVTSPGTLVGPGALVYANAVLRGVYPPQSIVKLRQRTEVAALRPKGD